jgi:hypothetical protein
MTHRDSTPFVLVYCKLWVSTYKASTSICSRALALYSSTSCFNLLGSIVPLNLCLAWATMPSSLILWFTDSLSSQRTQAHIKHLETQQGLDKFGTSVHLNIAVWNWSISKGDSIHCMDRHVETPINRDTFLEFAGLVFDTSTILEKQAQGWTLGVFW